MVRPKIIRKIRENPAIKKYDLTIKRHKSPIVLVRRTLTEKQYRKLLDYLKIMEAENAPIWEE